MHPIKKILNRFIRFFIISQIRACKCSGNNNIFLTFDDGPEPGIAEFVLDELGKYGYKATFFCRGDNAEKYPQLMERIRREQHAIGNHTFSHLHAYDSLTSEYIKDVMRADEVLHTSLMRPPHGSLTLHTWLKLRSRFSIFFWSLNSGDSDLKHFNFDRSISTLCSQTKPGDIVLFHFCHRHENETRKLLPAYLKWLYDNGYKSLALK